MLSQLSIYHLRNLQAVSFDARVCNVFIGANGSGKTSLLESLHLLSRGKSFRHHQPKRYITHHCPHVTVHAKFNNGDSMAVQKKPDASTILRVNQQPVYVQSELTRRLPTLLIDPSSMDILEVGSSSRRQLLDWITFHVEQSFHPQWVAYQRLLKQRNTLLKKSPNLTTLQKQELASWDKGLANHAALITHYRQHIFAAWKPLFDSMLKQLLPDYAPYIQLRFMPGYNTDIALDNLLTQRLQQDSQLGYTRIGCHRADVQVLWIDDKEARQEVYEKNIENAMSEEDSLDQVQPQHDHLQRDETAAFIDATEGTIREQAANVLSRGEKKLLITALRLSQLPLLACNDQSMRSAHANFNTPYPDSLSTSTDRPQEASEINSSDVVHAELMQKTADYKNKVITTGKRDNINSDMNNLSLPERNFVSATSKHDVAHIDRIIPLVLLDDIAAELDERALNILLKALSSLSCQVFITSLDDAILNKVAKYWTDINKFHVKHGELKGIV